MSEKKRRLITIAVSGLLSLTVLFVWFLILYKLPENKNGASSKESPFQELKKFGSVIVNSF